MADDLVGRSARHTRRVIVLIVGLIFNQLSILVTIGLVLIVVGILLELLGAVAVPSWVVAITGDVQFDAGTWRINQLQEARESQW